MGKTSFLLIMLLMFTFIVPKITLAQSDLTPLQIDSTKQVDVLQQPIRLDDPNIRLFGNKLRIAGGHLRKGAKAYRLMPTRTLDAIAEEKEPYLLMGLTFIILPIELTLSRFYGEFPCAYHFGQSGNDFIEASTYLQPQQLPTLKLAGEDLRKYRNYGYLSSTFLVAGLGLGTYTWFKDLSGEVNSNFYAVSLGAILAGRALRLIPLHYARSSGKKLESFSSSFSIDTHNVLMQNAGKNLQAYANRTYWGYGLQAAGITLALVAGDNRQMKTIGIGTAILSWFIFDAIGASAANAAGEKLEELGNVLVEVKANESP
jgi:hypothetical protein